MPHPIKVDNSRPATVYDTARTLGVSKSRTDELVRRVRKIVHRDSKTGQVVIRGGKKTKFAENHSSRNANSKVQKTAARRAKSR